MRLIAPMLATAGTLPDNTDRPWSFEMEYDGCRMLASVGGGREPVLWTRAMNVVTPSYPEIAEALTAAFGGRGRIVLDGEVVVLDHGKPSFGLLQRRMGVAHATKPLQRRIPVTFLPFDVLALDDLDLMSASYLDRRAELTELDSIIQDVGGLPLTVPPHWDNQSSKIMLNGADLRAVIAQSLGVLVDQGQVHRRARGRGGDGQPQDTVDECGGSGRFSVCHVGDPPSGALGGGSQGAPRATT